jgi:hypothetical protein
MPCVYFHDLPVYRVDEDTYYRARDKWISDFLAEARPGLGPTPKREKQLQTDMEQYCYDKHGPWLFNEIVGFVRLHFLGSQVRGEYFSPRRKRLVRTRAKVLVYRTHKLAPEHNVPRDATNEQILDVVLEYIEACRKEEPRRHFDDSWLRTVGPMVDWNAVMRSGWRR